MSDITTIISQNNETLVSLEGRDYSSAIASSLCALANLRDCRNLHRPRDDQSKSRSGAQSLDWCMLLNESCKEDPDFSMPTFIYTRGIPLPPAITDLTIVGPILIFNVALSYHLEAEASGASTEDLHRAKRLYELAYGSQTAAENTLFRFAVINNIAVIDRQLGNIQESEYYINQLMSVLMLMVDQKHGAELRQLRGFLVNLPSTSKTAGAA